MALLQNMDWENGRRHVAVWPNLPSDLSKRALTKFSSINLVALLLHFILTFLIQRYILY